MNKYIIDANVALLAGTSVNEIPDEQLLCAEKCVEFIQNLMVDPLGRIALDSGGEILKEYRNAYTLTPYPNMATVFYEWALQKISVFYEDFVQLNKINDNDFENFPDSENLKSFDPPDRKYIAVAYSHPEKPPIVEAADSKWWGIKEDLEKNGMKIIFIDEEYIKNKYEKKIKEH